MPRYNVTDSAGTVKSIHAARPYEAAERRARELYGPGTRVTRQGPKPTDFQRGSYAALERDDFRQLGTLTVAPE